MLRNSRFLSKDRPTFLRGRGSFGPELKVAVSSNFTRALTQAWSLLSPQARTAFVLVVLSATFGAFLEIAALLVLSRFMGLVVEPKEDLYLGPLRRLAAEGGVNTDFEFATVFGLTALALLALANTVGAFNLRLSTRFIFQQDTKISSELLRRYLLADYLSMSRLHSADLIKNVHSGVAAHGVLSPLVRGSTYSVLVLTYSLTMLTLDPWISLGLSLFVAASYVIMSWGMRRSLLQFGSDIHRHAKAGYRSSSEALGGLKVIKVMGREETFLQRYQKSSDLGNQLRGHQIVLESFPRYFLEVVAFSSIIGVALYYLWTGVPSAELLARLSVYTFAGYRLIPAVHELYVNWNRIVIHSAALNEVVQGMNFLSSDEPSSGDPLSFGQSLRLEEVGFSYLLEDLPTLKQVTLDIPRGASVGIVGPTGAGKTTLVDLILGLLEPTEGRILIDGVTLDRTNRKAWQRKLGYVPQEIFLVDDTVTANIAFGIPLEDVDQQAVEEAAKASELHAFVSALPDGYDTLVGERGVRFSGGERQRLGLARALYSKPEVLILDEATSALDNLTERVVVQAIGDLSGDRTVITIAHRLSTVRDCDLILVLKEGTLVDSGTFRELSERSGVFSELLGSAQLS